MNLLIVFSKCFIKFRLQAVKHLKDSKRTSVQVKDMKHVFM
jgi:hypothetical protein